MIRSALLLILASGCSGFQPLGPHLLSPVSPQPPSFTRVMRNNIPHLLSPLPPQPLGSSFPRLPKRFVVSAPQPLRSSVSSVPQSATTPVNTPPENLREVLIIGAGPSGLGSAMELDRVFNEEGLSFEKCNITLVDRSKDITYFDAERGFSYLIGGRGHLLMDKLGLSEELTIRGSAGSPGGTIRWGADNSQSKANMRIPAERQPYWIQRHNFVELMLEGYEARIQEAERLRGQGSKAARLNIWQGFSVKDIERIPAEDSSIEDQKWRIKVTLENEETKETVTHYPWLLIGADGLNSRVRQAMDEWAKQDQAGEAADKFEMKLYPNPSSNLRYKVLTCKPTFPLSNQTEGAEYLAPNQTLALSSKTRDEDPFVASRLGFLPRRFESENRTANLITHPDHKAWKDPEMFTKEGMTTYLEEEFPQVQWDKTTDSPEIERFAKSSGGTFPTPQTTKGGAAMTLKRGGSDLGKFDEVGAVILGDALHSFPPDLGQGVNAAMGDVDRLGKHLAGESDSKPQSLGQALTSFEKEAHDEAKALVWMQVWVYPHQYNLPGWGTKIGRLHFTIFGVLLPMFLSRIPLLGKRIFHPPVAFMLQNADKMKYREILTKHRITWMSALALFLTGFFWLLKVA